MEKWLIKIDNNIPNVVQVLEKYGKVEKVSILLNIFSIEGENLPISKIKRLKGIIYVEKDEQGELMVAL